MIRARAMLLLSVVLAAPASAQFVSHHGPVPELMTEWQVEAAPPPAGVRYLGPKDHVLKQRLLPSGLVVLGRPLTKAEAGVDLPAGTQLIEVKSTAGAVFCEGKIQMGKWGGRKQACLLDANWDGQLEAAFHSSSQAPGLVNIQGKIPRKRLSLAAPVAYQRIDPGQSQLGAFVAIERRNFFNIYAMENFQILYGSGEKQERITSPVGFKSSEMPREVTIMGARFTALGEKEGKMAIRVDEAMPAQPFSVIQTTSYR